MPWCVGFGVHCTRVQLPTPSVRAAFTSLRSHSRPCHASSSSSQKPLFSSGISFASIILFLMVECTSLDHVCAFSSRLGACPFSADSAFLSERSFFFLYLGGGVHIGVLSLNWSAFCTLHLKRRSPIFGAFRNMFSLAKDLLPVMCNTNEPIERLPPLYCQERLSKYLTLEILLCFFSCLSFCFLGAILFRICIPSRADPPVIEDSHEPIMCFYAEGGCAAGLHTPPLSRARHKTTIHVGG